MAKPAVVLLSGGIDSATTLALAKEAGYELYALTINYGQQHRYEIYAATQVADFVGVREHKVLYVDLPRLVRSALTGAEEIPKGRSLEEIGAGIPPTYVPARNTIFLALALGWIESLGGEDIFLGANAVDYAGYPDCRPEFIAAFERLCNLATREGVEGRARYRVHTPLIRYTKAQIIKEGLRLGLDYSLTSSCYNPGPSGRPCRECDSCLLRRKGFAELGARDPLDCT